MKLQDTPCSLDDVIYQKLLQHEDPLPFDTVYSTSYKPWQRTSCFNNHIGLSTKGFQFKSHFTLLESRQVSERWASMNERLKVACNDLDILMDTWRQHWLSAGYWIISQWQGRWLRALNARLEEYEDDNMKNMKRFGDWMIGWWIPTMTPKNQGSTKRRHLLIAIQVIACRHGSYSTSLLTTGQHSTSIHPSFARCSPRHHLQCCISVLLVFQPMGCCMIFNRRSYSSLQQHDPFLVSFGKSVTDCLCHSIIGRLLMQQHTWMISLQDILLVVSMWHIGKEKQQLIDDSFLVWLMHSQWRCASGGCTRHNYNWIKKEYIQKQWLSCIGTQGLSRLKRSCWDDWWTKQTTLDQKTWIMDDARHAVIMVLLQWAIPTLSVVNYSESISSEARTQGVPSASNIVWNTFLSMRLPFVSNNERHVWSSELL